MSELSTVAAALKGEMAVGSQVTVKGWLRSKRRQSKVKNLDDIVSRHHQVMWLTVTMHHPSIMSVLQPLGGLANVVAGFLNWQRAALLNGF